MNIRDRSQVFVEVFNFTGVRIMIGIMCTIQVRHLCYRMLVYTYSVWFYIIAQVVVYIQFA